MSADNRERICVIVPTYNNCGTLLQVLERVHLFSRDIIVVDDGCTDETEDLLSQTKEGEFIVVRHSHNRGKGAALRSGFRKAIELGYDYAITIDSDGQHFPEDIPLFVKDCKDHPGALIVGNRNLTSDNMPSQNTFANKFSNFWFRLQTGHKLQDTQTGYRLYPLKSLYGLGILTSRYEAELELLVFAAWHGVQLIQIPVRVYYPPAGERVSHFRPFRDFFRISVLNTVLCLLALVYALPIGIYRRCKR